jgi:hypothetical protein
MFLLIGHGFEKTQTSNHGLEPRLCMAKPSHGKATAYLIS